MNHPNISALYEQNELRTTSDLPYTWRAKAVLETPSKALSQSRRNLNVPNAQIPQNPSIFKDAIRSDDVRLAAQKRLRAKHALLDLQAEEAARNASVQQ